MCVSTVAACVIAYRLPVLFTSEATVLVKEQQVPQRFVAPTSTVTIAEALQTMTRDVLSRKQLLQLIDQFGLYAKEQKRLAPDDVAELMRKHIEIEPIVSAQTGGSGDKDVSAFTVSFSADRPILAQEVTSQLTSLFVQQNLKVREQQAAATTTFLSEHVDAAKKTLTEQEERLRDFKMQNLGELPEQQQGNVAILSGIQAQLQNTVAGLARARQQQVYLQSLLDEYRRLSSRGARLPDTSNPIAASPVAVDPVQAAENDLVRLKSARAQLLITYREQYPAVVAIDRDIAVRQASLQGLKSAKAAVAPRKDPDPKTKSPETTAISQVEQKKTESSDDEESSSIAQVKSQLEANRREIEDLSKLETQQNKEISDYQSRLNLTPVREQQLSGISRDYELSRKDYLDLLAKKQQSELAASLEERQGGQQLRLAETPSLPLRPSSPKRLKIALGGAGGGIVLGLVLAVLIDIRTPRLHDEKEAIRRFSVPLTVGLPLLLTPAETRFRKWKSCFEWLAGTSLTLAVLVVEFYVYRHP